MTDLSKTIAPKSDQLNADDLLAGPRTIRVSRVSGVDDTAQPILINFDGDNGKPYKPCLSMRRVLVMVWGPDGAEYPGRSMTLFNDPNVTFGGIRVGGIRISHMSHIDRRQSLMLTTTRGKRGEYTVEPLAGDAGEEVLLSAKQAAGGGVKAFTEFWNSPKGKENREYLRSHMDDLKRIAAAADDESRTLADRLSGDPGQDETHQFNADAVDPFAEPYDEGVKASKAAMREDMNPHEPGSEDWNNWLGGFRFHQDNKENAE